MKKILLSLISVPLILGFITGCGNKIKDGETTIDQGKSEQTKTPEKDTNIPSQNTKPEKKKVEKKENSSVKRSLKDEILSENIIGKNITWDGPWQTSDESGLYEQTTSTGTTYYFRGKPETNYLKFDDALWRIIRVNEDGSIRIASNYGFGTTDFNSDPYNYLNMYYSNSNAKKEADAWFKKYITGEKAKKVVKGKFCESANYENKKSDKKADVMKNSQYKASFDCKTDVNNKGILESYVGLITYDEFVFAGGWYGSDNLPPAYFHFLRYKESYWTMTPGGILDDVFQNSIKAWIVDNLGTGGNCIVDTKMRMYIHPVLNLKSDIQIIGSGTLEDPYIVQ